VNRVVAAPAEPFGWSRTAAAGISFRPVTDADLPFLYRVYASTRTEELAVVPWSDAEKAAFLIQQFNAQHADYRRNYAQADWLVLLRAGEAIGRLYFERRAKEHHVLDITLLPEHRGQGFGTALFSDFMDEAATAGRPLSIYVEKFNPALKLYRRLGFRTIEESGVYDLMSWDAQDAQVNTAS
jgi:ribosomal protein S18 acetylase RimI-like enzyme